LNYEQGHKFDFLIPAYPPHKKKIALLKKLFAQLERSVDGGNNQRYFAQLSIYASIFKKNNKFRFKTQISKQKFQHIDFISQVLEI
jgi:hypothetical protein